MNNQKTNRADLEKQLVGMTFADAEKVGLKWGNDHLPILPKENLWLVSYAEIDTVKRFAKLFAKVWKSLPKAAQDTLQNHWEHKRGIVFQMEYAPFITLSPHLSGATIYQHSRCRDNGLSIEYSSNIVRLMPDNIVRILIAEELCNAYMCACMPKDILHFGKSELCYCISRMVNRTYFDYDMGKLETWKTKNEVFDKLKEYDYQYTHPVLVNETLKLTEKRECGNDGF